MSVLRKFADKIQLDPVDISEYGDSPLNVRTLASLLPDVPSLDLFPTAVLHIPLVRGKQEVGELVAHPNVCNNPRNLVAIVFPDREKTRYALASVPPAAIALPTTDGIENERLAELAARWINGGPRTLSALANIAAELGMDKSGQTFYNFSNWLGVCFVPPVVSRQKHYVLLVGDQVNDSEERGTLYCGGDDEYVYVSGEIGDTERLFGYCAAEWGGRIIVHNPSDGAVTTFIARVIIRGKNHIPWRFADTTVIGVSRRAVARVEKAARAEK